MKCEKCKKNQADTHIKRVINGEFQEYNLCSQCASEMGYSNFFDEISKDITGSFNSMLGGFFSNALPARSHATRCEMCGTTYGNIAQTGMMGCENCYKIFAEQLMPNIRRVHGNTTHCGKHSVYAKKENNQAETKADSVDSLKEQLNEAIKNQEFEKAAELRDKIKEMEG